LKENEIKIDSFCAITSSSPDISKEGLAISKKLLKNFFLEDRIGIFYFAR